MATSSESQIRRFAVGTDPSLFWQTVEEDGVGIISDVVPLDIIQRFKQEIEPQVETWENAALKGWKFSPHTQFVNGLVSASQAYRHDILNNAVMHQICEAAFKQTGDYWLVSAVHRLTEPGHPAQDWHRDANGWPLVKSQQPGSPLLTITIIIPTTEFTKDNGATRVFLGSHRWPAVDVPSEARPAIAEMKPGDMLVMRQGLVHSGGIHTSEAPDTRSMLILSVASCQLTQYESALTLPRELVESLTPLVQKLVGWRTVFPLGHPMGLNTYRSGLVEEKLDLQANQPLKDQTET
ncbi:Verruculogen synthase [Xylariaceae sp. FL1651]|nr:Verruculogen synthase [Xylariaceae sp. FL1651]